MVEETEGIYERKVNTSDWPYLFENANMNKELAGFAPAADMIRRSAITMQDIADNVARFRKLYTEGNLCPLCQGDRIHRFSHSDGDSVCEAWMLCPVCCGHGVVCLTKERNE